MKEYIIEKSFSKFARARKKDRISTLLTYAGIETPSDIWLGSRVLLILLFGLIGFLIPFSLFFILNINSLPFLGELILPIRILLGFIFAFILMFIVAILVYLHLYYLISERTKRVERVLPDFLLMVAANLRSGMTPFAAFQAAARPEFGPLQNEIIYITSRSLGTESFAESLRLLSESIDSAALRRLVTFFENELKTGGKMAHLLETAAEELRQTEESKTQMLLATKSYGIFLGFILVFGLPLLLGISTQFLTTFSKFQSNLSIGAAASSATAMLGPMITPKLSIDIGFIEMMAFVIIGGTSFLTSVLIGVISEGKILYGVKYFPILALASSFMFTVFKTLISGFIGALIL
jgi:pilus assembly protein TadC